MPFTGQAAMKPHTRPVKEVLAAFNSSESGLGDPEANKRLDQYGPNQLQELHRVTPLKVFARQFQNILIWVLIVAAAIAGSLGLFEDTIVIAVTIAISVVLGFVQEWRAEKAMAALRQMVKKTARVVRDGKEIDIPTENVVPGDIIILEEGVTVPADARVIQSSALRIDEAALTGESIPVDKQTAQTGDVLLNDRVNMVYSSTAAVSGRGRAVVTSTGMRTEFGKIAGLVQLHEVVTPLQKKLTTFSRQMGILVVLIIAALFVVGLGAGREPLDMFLVAVSLAVAAVPEGLPAILTIGLASAAQRMARKCAIVRRMSAVESLGGSTVICSDKTGTMTTGEMTVTKFWTGGKLVDATGIGFEPVGEFWQHETIDGHPAIAPFFPTVDPDSRALLTASVLCNNAQLKETETGWAVVGDPTEGALLVLAEKAGGLDLTDAKRMHELPFTSERKRMSVIIGTPRGNTLFTKGAPEVMLRLCNYWVENGEERPLIPSKLRELHKTYRDLAADGLRVLAYGYRELSGSKEYSEKMERDFVFLGFTGIVDPPRPEIPAAVAMADRAGIQVSMITGDHRLTASAIAREIGLIEKADKKTVLTGTEIENMSERQLVKAVGSVRVFARASPEHKLRILKAFKARGNIVTMTGDGVNDAPALKAADAGVAMGIRGTDVAKESSDIVLTDDNFATIVTAVEEGRHVHDNIRKFMRFMLSCNFTEVILIATSIMLGLPLPLLPLQILWANLVTDTLPAAALSFDPREPGIMSRRPRNPKSGLLTGMWRFILVGAIVGASVAFIAFWITLSSGASIAKAQTMTFTTTIFFEMLFVFNCRSERHSVWKIGFTENRMLLGTAMLAVILQLLVVYLAPLQAFFGTVALGINDWALVAVLIAPGLFVSPRLFRQS